MERIIAKTNNNEKTLAVIENGTAMAWYAKNWETLGIDVLDENVEIITKPIVKEADIMLISKGYNSVEDVVLVYVENKLVGSCEKHAVKEMLEIEGYEVAR